MKVLRLILGDQLNSQHPWLQNVDEQVTYTLMEVASESEYVTHHIQKIVGFFGAMRQFAQSLESAGHNVIYIKISDPTNAQNFPENLLQLLEQGAFQKFEYQEPDEYRLDAILKTFVQGLSIPHSISTTHHFLTQRNTLKTFFEGKKTYLMETFYRAMRKDFNLLMEGDQPAGGKWNYDTENRKALPANHTIPPPKVFQHNVTDLVHEINDRGLKHMGSINTQAFFWPLNRDEALELLAHFCEHLLPNFGKFQDALDTRDWSLYHSRISFALNLKMLTPLEVCQTAIQQYNNNPNITLPQIEGFVRQIIGWREYMRGVYWAQMPNYQELNYFNHQNPLPSWFWTGKTKMKCLQHAIGQSLEYAYAHHIQRLMVTGNFALLAGIHPDELDAWYLGIYIDAIEWVEITNTRGMSQFADGGIVGTKPYNSSANYINKMSNYCKGCHYNHKERVGEKACPFNSLYWNFYERNREQLSKNPRIGMAYRNLDKMSSADRAAIMEHAAQLLEHIEQL
ncbi:MAG: cryptochrome/photolyase family protein [Schleiferiaceae bacterium]|nr:cryptochrome/photolyase family protein [Schleiferiaceae bacterium]